MRNKITECEVNIYNFLWIRRKVLLGLPVPCVRRLVWSGAWLPTQNAVKGIICAYNNLITKLYF
jgi:hypothetical protein